MHSTSQSRFIQNKTNLLIREEYIGKEIIDLLNWFIMSFKSDNTQQSYSRDLEEFFLFAFKTLKIKITSLKQITERLVLLWKESLTEFSIASIARKLSSLSSLLTYARKKGLIEYNILELIKKPKLDKKGKTNILKQEEVLKLLEYCKKQYQISKCKKSRTYCVWRLRYTVMYTLFTVGMRVEELCELKIKHLEKIGQNWKLHLTTKGDLPHSPFIHQNTAQVLIEYKNEFRQDAHPDDFFFTRSQLSKNTTKLNRASIFDMVKVAVKESGIFRDVSPHSFRTTLATLLHSEGVPIIQIQNLLNHKLTATTSIYIKKSNELSAAATRKIGFFD
ncbi:site-specific integrase [Pigmentibacter sp. JX0631]|uniref:tyrosine-type recombinase/integrase n=1 Tax=Pigmentibacter sp. JX0631 TaxID=2976982 RepID=UPI002468BA04|nr:site-specific integrase [Pigmentibacter sp. JX0631]WGL59659.1 site-specific integrase [Pigmentibacter sp. JX0631]